MFISTTGLGLKPACKQVHVEIQLSLVAQERTGTGKLTMPWVRDGHVLGSVCSAGTCHLPVPSVRVIPTSSSVLEVCFYYSVPVWKSIHLLIFYNTVKNHIASGSKVFVPDFNSRKLSFPKRLINCNKIGGAISTEMYCSNDTIEILVYS